MGQTTQSGYWSILLMGGLVALVMAGCEDLVSKGIEATSLTPTGATGNNSSGFPRPSADGNVVVFQSHATDLVAEDTNNKQDIFVYDRTTGEVTRISVDSSGTEANGDSFSPSISADGRFVAFESYATNLVTGDTNNQKDAFVHDRLTGQTTRVSVASDGTEATHLFLYPNYSLNPSISANGRFVAFESRAVNLVAGDANDLQDIFVHDRLTGETTRVSVASDGAEAIEGNSARPSISADGRFVAFDSNATNLGLGSNVVLGWQVYIHDRVTGETVTVSVNAIGNPSSGWNTATHNTSISADGRFVAFDSPNQDLVPGGTSGWWGVFVRDLIIGETTLVSVASDGTMATGGGSARPSLSADGCLLTFQSDATNLAPEDTNGLSDIFVHDCSTGETTRLSVDFTGKEADAANSYPSLSADGRTVTFMSAATNLVTGDANGSEDAFITPNPLASTFDPIADDDGDGLVNYQELTVTFTHYFKADSDGDGVDDDVEIGAGTDPLDPANF